MGFSGTPGQPREARFNIRKNIQYQPKADNSNIYPPLADGISNHEVNSMPHPLEAKGGKKSNDLPPALLEVYPPMARHGGRMEIERRVHGDSANFSSRIGMKN